jgi:hypothetical protein
MAAPLTYKQRMAAAAFLTQNFKFERYVYLSLSTIGAGLALALAAWMGFVLNDTGTVFAMLGASGVLTLSLGRVLYIWNTISKVIVKGEI